MARTFTVFGYWDDSDQPVPVAVVELIGGGYMDIGGGEGCSEGGPWATDVDAIDMGSAEALAVEEMLSTLHALHADDDAPDLSDKFTIRDNPNPQMDQQFEHHEVVDLPLNQVWTVVEGDNGKLYALIGFHIVNKLHYAVTEEPWTEEDEGIDYKW